MGAGIGGDVDTARFVRDFCGGDFCGGVYCCVSFAVCIPLLCFG